MTNTCLFILAVAYGVGGTSSTSSFNSSIPSEIERMWVGPEYWANRLQDWRISDGRIECVETSHGKPMRSLHLLPYSLGKKAGDFQMSVSTGVLNRNGNLSKDTWTGFLIGAGGGEIDYRGAALVHHAPGMGGGIIAGLDGQGSLFFRDMSRKGYPMLPIEILHAPEEALSRTESLRLILAANSDEDWLELSLSGQEGLSGKVRLKLESSEALAGNVALVSHPGKATDAASYWFRDWKISGSRLIKNKSGTFGPVLSALYTVNEGILKMSAQFPVLGKGDPKGASLDFWNEKNSTWEKVAESIVEEPSYIALFRVNGWDGSRGNRYRIRYTGMLHGHGLEESCFEGVVMRDPVDKKSITVAAFTGNQNMAHHVSGERKKDAGHNDSFDVGTVAVGSRWTSNNVWFPHEDISANVEKHHPDLLVFTGDQVYEGNPTYPGYNNPFSDYMYKWYLWCWAFRDLTRNIPTVCIPDDHDVYQGNLWGWGGKRTPCEYPKEGAWSPAYNQGGYWMPPDWIRMVERTQTAHLPDPYDPTLIEQGIGVYYTGLKWGEIGFAILEDRKFKTPPPYKLSIQEKTDSVRSVYGKEYAPRLKDIPEGRILGDRQLDFIRDWADDWEGVCMKVSLSQTVFAAAHTKTNLFPGEPAKDLDTNGWPSSGRNQALAELRKCFTFMIGGDQHLATVIHHGIDQHNDAGFSFCVPSIANYWTRSWMPEKLGENFRPGMSGYTGEFLDGWGNKINVYAVANPKSQESLSKPELLRGRTELHRKAAGYGLVKFNKEDRSITMECWPRYADPEDPATGGQYPGWPVVVSQEDNYGRKAVSFLPRLKFRGVKNPLVKIVSQDSGELVYAIRVNGESFKARVFEPGVYTVIVIDPPSGETKILKEVNAISKTNKEEDSLVVKFG